MSAEPRVLSGRYRVDDLIGRGGMASVYRGEDTTLGRTVAIKILKPELAADASFRTRFRLEAQAASRMSHPAIVRVFDAGEDVAADVDGHERPVPYIIMELVDGRLQKDVIAAGDVPVGDAVRYVDGILEALEYSHRAGVVHRDIKPGNVMVTPGGQVKVMDFGIARAVSDSSSTVAETTAIIGTAAYFSPEQAKGEPVDGRADLYSAGVVLYELLTGRAPFRGESPVAVAYQHVSEAPVPPSELDGDVSRSLDAVVLRALAKDPYQRYQDAAAFRAALDSTTEGATPTKRQMTSLQNRLYGADPRQAAETARSLRQLSTDTTMRRTQSGPPVAWIWTGVAVLAVLLVSVLIWVVTIQPGAGMPGNARIVPDLSDVSWDRAEEELTALDLVAKRVEESSDAVTEGNVIRTDPVADTSVATGQEVVVYVSTGQEMATIPTITSLSRAEAAAALEAAGLRLGTVTPRNDPALATDVVISSSPTEGASVATGSVVNLEVASGKVTVVNMFGWSLDSASEELQSDEIRLTPERVDDPNCVGDAAKPTVASQSAIGDVPIGSTIQLVVCTGS